MSTPTITRPAIIPLTNYYLFPRYQTREDYRVAAGVEPPPFDARRAPKYWRDPSAMLQPRNNVVYSNVLWVSERGIAVPGTEGRPQLDVLVLSKAEAATVNIPPSGSAVEGAEVPEVQVPLRDLEPGMQLEFGYAGVVRVRDTTVAEPYQSGAFTANDRVLLQAIAHKLGVGA